MTSPERLEAERLAVCHTCAWYAERGGGVKRCDYPLRRCAKLFPRLPRFESCPLGKWNDQPDTTTMNTPPQKYTYEERLKVRRDMHQSRVQKLADLIAVTESRLVSLRQQHQMAVGEAKALTEVIAETAEAAEKK
jgi:hypothetical protein